MSRTESAGRSRSTFLREQEQSGENLSRCRQPRQTSPQTTGRQQPCDCPVMSETLGMLLALIT